MNLVSIFLCLVLVVWIVFLTIKYKKLKNSFRRHKKALRSIARTINSIRYGNIYNVLDSFAVSVLPNFSESMNRMIEAIVDREDMIKEYQKELNEQIEAQKEIQKLKEDFVATLTHDLKVPIIAENNMLNFLVDGRFGELNEAQKEAVFHLKNSNKELVELVEILLETYKLNDTQINLTKESVDISRLIESVLAEMEPIAQANHISFEFDTKTTENILLDEFYIKRVLKNLIFNAISFSCGNSSVEISVEKSNTNIFVKIKNYGNIIKTEDLDHIFDKYYSSANKFRKVGTGLGLYLSNKIINAHDGEIFASSDTDENSTTFEIVLPLKSSQNTL